MTSVKMKTCNWLRRIFGGPLFSRNAPAIRSEIKKSGKKTRNQVIFMIYLDVEQDTSGCVFTERQRPEYVIMGGGCYSLRDPIEANGNRSAERWLQAHSQ